MTTTLRTVVNAGATTKGSALTHAELDNNFLFTAAGTGAVARTVQEKGRDIFNAADFGCSPSASAATNVSAIQAALDAAKAASTTINEVWLPSGDINVNAAINIKGEYGANTGITIRGSRTRLIGSHNGPVLHFHSTDGVTTAAQFRIRAWVDGVDITGPGVASTSSACVKIEECADVYLSNGTYRNAYYGIQGLGALTCEYHLLRINANQINVHLRAQGGFSPNAHNFFSCRISDALRQAFSVDGFDSGAINFFGCVNEGNNSASGTKTDATRQFEFLNAGKVCFIGCHLEGNEGQDGIYYSGFDATKTLSIINCEMLDEHGSMVNVVAGVANISGGRIANMLSTNYVNLSTANSYAFIEACETTVTASTAANVIWARKKGFAAGMTGSANIANAASFQAMNMPNDAVTRGDADIVRHMFYDAGGVRVGFVGSYDTGALLQIAADAGVGIGFSANAQDFLWIYRAAGDTVEPGRNNVTTLGSASLRWKEFFCGNATINTSDERLKQQIKPIDDAVLRAWGKVNYCQFKWNEAVEKKGDGARWHFGLIAQRVKEAFESEGLDAFAYGLLCYDKWEDDWAPDDKDGGKMKLRVKAGDRYGLRYEQALALECAYLRSRLA